MSATLHHRVNLTGTLVGEESTHGTEASTIDLIPGISVVFAEATEENYTDYYDPASGQELAGMYQGVLDVAGSMSFYLADFRFAYWGLGSEVMNEIYLDSPSADWTAGSTVTGDTSSATATVDSYDNSTQILTISSISGTFQHGEGLTESVNGTETATLGAFIHDISRADDPVSLTIEEIYAETDMDESEKYLGMRCSDFTISSSRGDLVNVDFNMIGLSEETETSTPGTRAANTLSPFVWNTGSISINSVNYDNVCDNFTVTVTRNSEARGGHNRGGHEVIAGNFLVDATFEMDLPSSAIRTLRRNATQVTIELTLTHTANDRQATITLSNCYVISDPREQPRDNTVVRTSVAARTGSISIRSFDEIFDYST